MSKAVQAVLEAYPRIFFACHRRHCRDPKSRRSVSRQQAAIRVHLDELEPMPLNELASHLGVTSGTLSLNIERLVSKGFVRRTRSAGDRRWLELRLTTSGARIKSDQQVLDSDRVASLLAQLNQEEQREAVRGLRLLAEAAARMMTQRRRRGGAK